MLALNTKGNTDYIVSSCCWLIFNLFLERVLTLVWFFFLSERWTQPLLQTDSYCGLWSPSMIRPIAVCIPPLRRVFKILLHCWGVNKKNNKNISTNFSSHSVSAVTTECPLIQNFRKLCLFQMSQPRSVYTNVQPVTYTASHKRAYFVFTHNG